jgi:hypothetical protein
VGTGDDNCVGLPEAILLLGPDGNFSDAARVRQSNFTRTITITRINANSAQIQVIVTYSSGLGTGRYYT